MGMSTNVIAFISHQDDTYQKHSKVLRACIDAGINKLPQETAVYFGSDHPCESLFEEKLEIPIPLNEWSSQDASGFEILVKDIPNGVYKLRFYNGW